MIAFLLFTVFRLDHTRFAGVFLRSHLLLRPKELSKKKERKTSCYYCFGKKNENARYPFAVAPIQGVARGP